jgi:Na+(H+)/acetate symporter ActP
VGAVITLNVALGGMKGITLVQAFQYWAKMFAISVPIFVLMAVYGHYGKQLGVNKSLSSATKTSIIEGSIISSEQLSNAFPELHFALSYSSRVDPTTILKHVGSNRVAVEAIARQALNLLTFDYVTNPVSLSSLLAGYSRATGLNIWVPINDPMLRTNWILNPLKFDNRSRMVETVSSLWQTNGFHLVSVGPDAVALLSTNYISRIPSATARKQMPDKAPADSTWLSPFGPLTTKAAKTAGITGEAAKPYSLLYTYSLIIALVCGTAGLPHILVRFYTNPDGVAAKRTTMWVMILIGIFYVFPPVFGVMGRNLFPELYSGVGAEGTDKIVLELPRLLAVT